MYAYAVLLPYPKLFLLADVISKDGLCIVLKDTSTSTAAIHRFCLPIQGVGEAVSTMCCATTARQT